MSGGADGLFTIIRPEDPAQRYMVVVRCDLCQEAVGFDCRAVKRPMVKAQAIAKAHVCKKPEKIQKRKPGLEPDVLKEHEGKGKGTGFR